MRRTLTRTRNSTFLGVAQGIANYTELDVTIIRLLFVLFTLAGGPGLIVYLIMALIMPIEDSVSDVIDIKKDNQ